MTFQSNRPIYYGSPDASFLSTVPNNPSISWIAQRALWHSRLDFDISIITVDFLYRIRSPSIVDRIDLLSISIEYRPDFHSLLRLEWNKSQQLPLSGSYGTKIKYAQTARHFVVLPTVLLKIMNSWRSDAASIARARSLLDTRYSGSSCHQTSTRGTAWTIFYGGDPDVSISHRDRGVVYEFPCAYQEHVNSGP